MAEIITYNDLENAMNRWFQPEQARAILDFYRKNKDALHADGITMPNIVVEKDNLGRDKEPETKDKHLTWKDFAETGGLYQASKNFDDWRARNIYMISQELSHDEWKEFLELNKKILQNSIEYIRYGLEPAQLELFNPDSDFNKFFNTPELPKDFGRMILDELIPNYPEAARVGISEEDRTAMIERFKEVKTALDTITPLNPVPGDYFTKDNRCFLFAGRLNNKDYILEIQPDDQIKVFTGSITREEGYEPITAPQALDKLGQSKIDLLAAAGRSKSEEIKYTLLCKTNAEKAFGWIAHGNYDEAAAVAKNTPQILLVADASSRTLLDHLVKDGGMGNKEIRDQILISPRHLAFCFQHNDGDPVNFLNVITEQVSAITGQAANTLDEFKDEPVAENDKPVGNETTNADTIIITADDGEDDEKPEDNKKPDPKRTVILSDTDKWLSEWGKCSITDCAEENADPAVTEKPAGVPMGIFFSKPLGIREADKVEETKDSILEAIFRRLGMGDAEYQKVLDNEPKYFHVTQNDETKEYSLHIALPYASDAENLARTEEGLTPNDNYNQSYLVWCVKHGAERAGLTVPELDDVPIVMGGRGQNLGPFIQNVNYKDDKLHLEVLNPETPEKSGTIEADKNAVIGKGSSDPMIAGLVALAKEMPAKRYNIAASGDGLIKMVKAFDAHGLEVNNKTKTAFKNAMNAKRSDGGEYASFEDALKAAKPQVTRIDTGPIGGGSG